MATGRIFMPDPKVSLQGVWGYFLLADPLSSSRFVFKASFSSILLWEAITKLGKDCLGKLEAGSFCRVNDLAYL